MKITQEFVMEAINNYSSIRYQSIAHIGTNANSVFKITDQMNNCYSLRIHQSRNDAMEDVWTEKEVIHSEMVWLEALTRETDLVVPSPIKNNDTDYVTSINGLNCTLLKWVDGEQKPIVPSSEEAGYVGEMIGKLHKHSSAWIVPFNFHRPLFDHTRILQSLEKLSQLADKDELNKDEVKIVKLAGERAISMMTDIEGTSGNWGIIHADLIPNNFVFYEREVRAIDFGACGFGYYLFDLGWTFSYIHPSFRSNLLEAYTKHFELPTNYIELLEGFFVAAQLETMNFWIGLPESKEWLPGHIGKLASREFQSYVNKQEFLFSGIPYWE